MMSDRISEHEYRQRSTLAAGTPAVEVIIPKDGELRARRVVSRSRARATGKYPSWKMGRMMEWESQHELNAFRLLDVDPTATAFHEKPFTIRFSFDGRLCLRYPALLIERRHCREVWDVRPQAKLMEPSVAAENSFLRSELPTLGFEYHVVDAEQLARQPRLSNALTLLKYGRSPVTDVSREHVRRIFRATRAIVWQSATSGDLGQEGREILCRLALEGVLLFDIEKELLPASAFRFAGTANG
jgi:hypothetical protein